jgi:hypothetical protein
VTAVDPPVLDHGLACLAEMKALALADPCAAAAYWPPSQDCSAFWSEVGEWPPEEAGRQSVIFHIQAAYDECSPGFLAPATCDLAPGECHYNPSSAAACLDQQPWPCEDGTVLWGADCQEAFDCPA